MTLTKRFEENKLTIIGTAILLLLLAIGFQSGIFSSREATPTIQVLEDWEPIYREGSYWDRWSVDGFTALRYYDADQDAFSLNTLDVTRTDFATPPARSPTCPSWTSTRAWALPFSSSLRRIP